MAYTTIDDPSVYFQTAIYTGNGTGQAITFDGNSDMQPDFFWGKCRSTSSGHHLQNSTTGVKPFLVSNSDAAENTDSNNTDFLSYDSNGFTLGATYQTDINHDTRTYVAWNWKANGGTTTTNDASSTGVGTIDSVYQANTTAGFSIVTYTGTGSAGTVAHGIGAAPTFIMTKRRDDTEDWVVFHLSQGNDRISRLNTTDASSDLVQSGAWNDTSPTSTVFSLGSGSATNGSSRTIVAYCFAPIQGYSKFGNYVGTGNADGPFLYTGFKPAWVMIKETGATGSWHIFDNTRKVGNVSDSILYADLNNAEATSQTGNPIDILSNGFKCRGGGNDTNLDDGTYVYMAFAESPFVSSEGVPTTAV